MIEDYPDDKYGPSCLVLGFTAEGKAIHGSTKSGEVRMKKDVSEERFVEQKVTYTLGIDGRFVIVEMCRHGSPRGQVSVFSLQKPSSRCNGSLGKPEHLPESSRRPFSNTRAFGKLPTSD